jgi:hypothetical protein
LNFWEHADKHNLLASTVTKLTRAVGAADAIAVPATIIEETKDLQKMSYVKL